MLINQYIYIISCDPTKWIFATSSYDNQCLNCIKLYHPKKREQSYATSISFTTTYYSLSYFIISFKIDCNQSIYKIHCVWNMPSCYKSICNHTIRIYFFIVWSLRWILFSWFFHSYLTIYMTMPPIHFILHSQYIIALPL